MEELNPLDWTAGPFLVFYAALAVSVLAILWHWRSNLPPDDRSANPAGIDAVSLAYLAGGPERAADTALVGLFEAGAAMLAEKGGLVAVDSEAPVPPEFQPFRHAGRDAMRRSDFHAAFALRLQRIRADLAGRGLIPSDADTARFRIQGLLVLCLTLAAGIAKIVVGGERGHPVGILAFTVAATGVLGAMAVLTPPSRSRAGTRLLGRVREENTRALRAPVAEELAFAFALTGGAVLTGRSYRGFISQQSGGGSSSDGGGSSDGGSGCGGGGCGGCGS